MRFKLYRGWFLVVLLFPGLASTQLEEPILLSVTGAVEKPLKFKRSEFAKLPRRTVRAKNHDGKECTYEGVELREILARGGVKFGKELKGKWLATFVLVEAMDNYQTIFALPELDSLFTDRVILLADTCDGQMLPATTGPLQMIVPDEKRHGRWVRQVKQLTVVQSSQMATEAKHP